MWRGSANAPSQYVCVQPCMVKRRKRFEEGRKDEGPGGSGAWEGGREGNRQTGGNRGDRPAWVARGDIILNLNNPSVWDVIGLAGRKESCPYSLFTPFNFTMARCFSERRIQGHIHISFHVWILLKSKVPLKTPHPQVLPPSKSKPLPGIAEY